MISNILSFQKAYSTAFIVDSQPSDKLQLVMHRLLHPEPGPTPNYDEVQELYTLLVTADRPEVPPSLKVYQKSLIAIWTTCKNLEFSEANCQHLEKQLQELRKQLKQEEENQPMKVEQSGTYHCGSFSAPAYRRFASGLTHNMLNLSARIDRVVKDIEQKKQKVAEQNRGVLERLPLQMVTALIEEGCHRAAFDVVARIETGTFHSDVDVEKVGEDFQWMYNRIKINAKDITKPDEIMEEFREVLPLVAKVRAVGHKIGIFVDSSIGTWGEASAGEWVLPALTQNPPNIALFQFFRSLGLLNGIERGPAFLFNPPVAPKIGPWCGIVRKAIRHHVEERSKENAQIIINLDLVSKKDLKSIFSDLFTINYEENHLLQKLQLIVTLNGGACPHSHDGLLCDFTRAANSADNVPLLQYLQSLIGEVPTDTLREALQGAQEKGHTNTVAYLTPLVPANSCTLL